MPLIQFEKFLHHLQGLGKTGLCLCLYPNQYHVCSCHIILIGLISDFQMSWPFAHQKLYTGYYLCLECFFPHTWLTSSLINSHLNVILLQMPALCIPSTTPSRPSLTISWIIKQWPPSMCIISAGLSERQKNKTCCWRSFTLSLKPKRFLVCFDEIILIIGCIHITSSFCKEELTSPLMKS